MLKRNILFNEMLSIAFKSDNVIIKSNKFTLKLITKSIKIEGFSSYPLIKSNDLQLIYKSKS